MIIIKCTYCRKEKKEDEFDFFRGRRNKHCKDCREKNNLWYAKDSNGRKTKAKQRYEKMKYSVAQYRSDLRLKKKYYLSREEWNAMLVKQEEKCEICKEKLKKPCVDHNHETGKVRALLCRRCNLDLQVVENIEFVQKAQSYLESMR